MKLKKRSSSVKSSSENPTKRKKRISDSYLPDDCWECVFRFLNNNNNDDKYLSSLSRVSKQFLSITNGLLFSLRVKVETRPFLPLLFKRFTNLNTLDLTNFIHGCNLNDLLSQISTFPLKLTSLKLPLGCRFPVDGLQAFLQNITTLTSLTCYATLFRDMDLSSIVDCFPLLEELNLSHSDVSHNNTIHRLLSKSSCIQHLKLCNTSLNDQHVVDFSLFLGNLVSINLSACSYLTETTLLSLVRSCPSLTEIKMICTAIGKVRVWHSDSLDEFGVYPQLKSLYLAHNYRLSDEIIVILASIFPNLELLDLGHCYNISEGIYQVLRICCKLKHLNLTGCLSVKLHGMNFAVPELEVLNLSETKVDNETLYMISKNCCGLLQLLLENCKVVTLKGVKQVVENCTQLREIKLGRFHLSDENRKLLSRHGCHLC